MLGDTGTGSAGIIVASQSLHRQIYGATLASTVQGLEAISNHNKTVFSKKQPKFENLLNLINRSSPHLSLKNNMKVIRVCLFLLLATALATSCKKPVPRQARFIPKDAAVVASVNTSSLQSKLLKNEVTLSNIVRNLSGSDTTMNKGRQELEDLKASGIDLDDNFYLAVANGGTGRGPVVTSAIGSLNDAAKFEAYIKKKGAASEIRKEKEFSYATINGDKMVAWGRDVVILMSYQKMISPANMQYDSATGSFNSGTPGNATAEMKTEMQTNFNLKEDQSVAAIPEFRDLMQEKSDASIWVNSGGSIENLPLPLPRLKQLLSNNFTTAKVNFEEGKIVLDSKSYYSNELRDLLKKYSGATVNLGLVENYPSDNINAFGIFSFDPQLINEMVKYLEVGAIVDDYLSKMMGTNYTLPDLLKAFKGEFGIVVSDMSLKTAADTTAGSARAALPNMKMVVNIPIGDKMQMNRLMDKLVEMQMLEKVNNQYRLSTVMQRFGYQLSVDDQNVILASDETLLNQYKSKSKKAGLNQSVLNDFKGKTGAFYVNIESILNGINSSVNQPASNTLTSAKETFKDMEFYSDKFNGKYLEGHGEIRFKNEKQNSLTSFLSFAEVASRNVKGRMNPNDTDRRPALPPAF